MCLLERLNKNVLILGEFAIVIIIGVIHLVFGLLIKDNEFNAFYLFDSSPLFDFQIKNDCGHMSILNLHKWGGRLIKYNYKEDDDWIEKIDTIDKTPIAKINGNYFCYKHISYRELLNNGQIIKNGSVCPSDFPKNCGKLDTLKQELCIKENGKCPLYEIGIGNKSDDDNYTYNENSNIYYNNEKYNIKNKTIIGSLILNDGQPCYNSLEKLWKKFVSEEAVETNLKCDIEVYGKYNDDRYKNRGNITYKRLYQDNLNKKCQEMILNHLSGKENVSLYQREFLGIDKECDKNYILTKDFFENFHDNKKKETNLLLFEGSILLIYSPISFIMAIVLLICKKDEQRVGLWCCLYGILIAIFVTCFIFHILLFDGIKSYNIPDYNCSDPITNELIRKGNEDNSKNILYIKINFYADIFHNAINCFAILISLILALFDKLLENCQGPKEVYKSDENYNHEENNTGQNYEQDYPENPLIINYPESN